MAIKGRGGWAGGEQLGRECSFWEATGTPRSWSADHADLEGAAKNGSGHFSSPQLLLPASSVSFFLKVFALPLPPGVSSNNRRQTWLEPSLGLGSLPEPQGIRRAQGFSHSGCAEWRLLGQQF